MHDDIVVSVSGSLVKPTAPLLGEQYRSTYGSLHTVLLTKARPRCGKTEARVTYMATHTAVFAMVKFLETLMNTHCLHYGCAPARCAEGARKRQFYRGISMGRDKEQMR